MATQRRGGVVLATLFTAACMAILIWLGLWQLERKAWKENLIAVVSSRVERPAEPLPPRSDWGRLTAEANEYTRVTFPAEFLDGEEAYAYTAGSSLRADVQGQGFWVFAPARLTGGSVVLVNRGFVPTDRKLPASRSDGTPRGSVDIVGYLRWPETRGMVTPKDDPANNVWYARDPKAMAETHKWALAAPFYIDQEGPVPPGGLPKPGKLDVKMPNNHWQYALTWFGLAASLAGVYIAWLLARRRKRDVFDHIER
ncbi:MAG: SURF1 family protein [Pseudolabrys sp.]|nr:SURF1 family protein [Pseudolabrys sp.]